MNNRNVEAERLKVGFRRTVDGRVELQTREGEWFLVKNDMLTPGYMLLRDQQGYCYYLPSNDEEEDAVQFDLSDDLVVAQVGSWWSLLAHAAPC